MKKIAIAVSLIALIVTGCKKSDASSMTEEQKNLYAIGLVLGKQTSVFNLSAEELEWVKKGISDSMPGAKPQIELAEQGPKLDGFIRERQQKAAEKTAADGKAFAEKAAAEKGAEKSSTGLVYLSLKDGDGAKPTATDVVKVHYKGTLINGTEFDSSYKRGEPAEFPLGAVVPCWTEGLQKMKVGGKARLTCPPEIAYGDRGAGETIPPKSTLSFEVELLSISKPTPPAAAPAAPAKPKK